MLKIDKDSGKLLPVPRLALRTLPLSREYDLRQVVTANPEAFLSEIGEKLFLIGADVTRGAKPESAPDPLGIDLLGLDLNGRSVAVLVERDRAPSTFVRALLCSEYLARWNPHHFLERLSDPAIAELQKFLLADVWQLNRDQRLILVAEGHSNEVLWAAQNLRKQCGIDITLLRAALAVDSESGSHYLFLRREFPAPGADWATLVRPEAAAGERDFDPAAAFEKALPEDSSVTAVPVASAPLMPETPAAPVASAAPVAPAKAAAEAGAPAASEPKQDALRTLAGGLADYLGQAIAAVDGSAELALQEAPRDPAVRQRFEQIGRVVERVGRLNDELRIFAGRGSRNIEKINAAQLVEHATDSAAYLALPTVKLRTELDTGLPQIEGDPAQLARVLGSLLENAVESLPEKAGSIAITASCIHADHGYLSSCIAGEGLPEGDYVLIEVSDTGFGIDDTLRARIFDPFFTTKAPGRGLGLAAVLGIVRNHSGALRVESQPGQGSTFSVCFPIAKAPAGASGDAHFAGGIGEGRTILVVDEQESLRALVQRAFEAEGFRVLSVADGWEALDVFAKAADTIDGVVLDWMLSDLDAEEAFRAIRRIRSDTRVIVSGPFSEEEAEQRFSGKKLAAYLRKPFQAETLSACIRQLFENEPASSSAKTG